MAGPNIQTFIDAVWDADKAVQVSELAAKDALIAAAHAETVAAQQALTDYQRYVESNLGPMWDMAWEKQNYRGYPIDYTGYHETFRTDFTDLSQITPASGNGPWFSGGLGVHTYFGNAYFDGIDQNPQLYAIDDGSLRLRMMTPDGNVNTSWRSTIIQTMRTTDGVGFAQSKGIFEVVAKMPPAPAAGCWVSPLWLLSANEFAVHDDGKYGIEYDLAENYGSQPTSTNPGSADKGIHTTLHVKRRRVPLPGDYPDRVSQALYSDPQTVFNTDPATGLATSVHTFGPNVTLFGTSTVPPDYHTYTVQITDDWVIQYFDGKSIGRIRNKNGFASTPLYLLIGQTLKRPSYSPGLTSPVDFWTRSVRVLAQD